MGCSTSCFVLGFVHCPAFLFGRAFLLDFFPVLQGSGGKKEEMTKRANRSRIPVFPFKQIQGEINSQGKMQKLQESGGEHHNPSPRLNSVNWKENRLKKLSRNWNSGKAGALMARDSWSLFPCRYGKLYPPTYLPADQGTTAPSILSPLGNFAH